MLLRESNYKLWKKFCKFNRLNRLLNPHNLIIYSGEGIYTIPQSVQEFSIKIAECEDYRKVLQSL